MAVYIAAHKPFSVQERAGYIPLHVGAAAGQPLPFQGDDTGDSISEKNPHYCELTGLYWIWKNTADPYKGLVHYRRYFVRHGKILTEDNIRQLLEHADFLVPKPEYLRETAYEEFCLHSGHEHDLILLRQAVEAIDATVLPAYDRVMNANRLVLYNMCIAGREAFDRYCAWLFAVLGELEKHVDMQGYTPYEQRLYGFLAERLFNVWLAHTGAPVCHLRVINTERSRKDSLRLFLRRQKNRLLFALHRKGTYSP